MILVRRTSSCVFLCWIAASLLGCGENEIRLTPEPSALQVTRHPSGKSQTATITLKNNGTVDLRITSIDTSCTCAVVSDLSNKSLRPAESVEIDVAFSPPLFGERLTEICVNTDAEVSARIPVTLVGNASSVPALAHQSKAIHIERSIFDTNSVTREIEFRCLEETNAPRWIKEIACNDPVVSVELVSEPEGFPMSSEIVERHYVFEVTLDGAAGDELSTVLRPELTETADVTPQEIPLSVSVFKPIRCVPSELSFRSGEAQELLFISADQSEFRIEVGNQQTAGQFEVEFDNTRTSSVHRVRIRRTERIQPERNTATAMDFDVVLADGDHISVTIPIVL